jgi:RNA polymerase sigma factor (sigma-70 family)
MMTGPNGTLLRSVDRLFGAGTVAGLSEEQLLRRFVAERDEAAFEALVARHGPMVLGLCRRMLRDPSDADDAFQATFAILARRADSIRAGSPVGNWLYGVARRVAIRLRTETERRRTRERLDDDAVSAACAAPRHSSELRWVLDEEIGRLPDKYRAPIVLCYLEGLSHDEASERLSWPVGTVRGRMARAREVLRTRLIRRGIAPSAVVLSTTGLEAAVPAPLSEVAIQLALRLGSGPAATAGVASTRVLALADGVLQTMLVTKFKTAALAAIAGVVTTSVAVHAYQDSRTNTPSAGSGAPVAAPASVPTPTPAITVNPTAPAAAPSAYRTPPVPDPAGPSTPGALPGRPTAEPPRRGLAGQQAPRIPPPSPTGTAQPPPPDVASPASSRSPFDVPGAPSAQPLPAAAPVSPPGAPLPALPGQTPPVPQPTPAAAPQPAAEMHRSHNVQGLIDRTRAEIDEAVKDLALEETALTKRLEQVRSDLQKLRALQTSLAPKSPPPPGMQQDHGDSAPRADLAPPEEPKAAPGPALELPPAATPVSERHTEPASEPAGPTRASIHESPTPIQSSELAVPSDATARTPAAAAVPEVGTAARVPVSLRANQPPTPEQTISPADRRLSNLEENLDALRRAVEALRTEIDAAKRKAVPPTSFAS